MSDKIIEKLTKEQEDQIPIYLKKWVDNGLSTKPLDETQAIEALKNIYKIPNFEGPKYFLFFRSPYECFVASNIFEKLLPEDTPEDQIKPLILKYLENNEWKKQIKSLDNYSMIFGNIEWDIGWTGFYDYVLNVLFPERKNEFKLFESYADSLTKIHIFLPFENVVFFSDRPTDINLNEEGKLHADLKPALKYADGYSIYSLNGVRVPEYLVMTKGEDLNVLTVMGERNVDVRREGLRKIPLEKIINDTGAKVIDTWNDDRPWCDYTLYEMDFRDGKKRIVLRMKNPSEGTWHFERVEDDVKTVKQALAWRNGQEDYLNPDAKFYEREQLT